MRLDYASIDDEGKFISINDPDPKIREMAYEPPPKYEEQTYSTAYYLNSNVERDVFLVRKQRKTDVPLREVLTEVCKEEKVRYNNDQEMVDYFKNKLKQTKGIGLIDMNFFSSYIPKIGFRYNLEALIGVH